MSSFSQQSHEGSRISMNLQGLLSDSQSKSKREALQTPQDTVFRDVANLRDTPMFNLGHSGDPKPFGAHHQTPSMQLRANKVFSSLQQPNRLSSDENTVRQIQEPATWQPAKRGGRGSDQYFQNDQELEDFMKSTNSAFSDYNFLFENIDQTLHTNTQLMVEELLQQANNLSGYQEASQKLNLQKEASPGPDRSLVSSQNEQQVSKDVTEDEIISIEDTYRETAGLGKHRQEEDELLRSQDESSQPPVSKSMTIIQEDEGEYEDSQFMRSQSHLLQSSKGGNSLLLKSQTLAKQLPLQLQQMQLGPLNAKESYETFGQPNQNSSRAANNDLKGVLANQSSIDNCVIVKSEHVLNADSSESLNEPAFIISNGSLHSKHQMLKMRTEAQDYEERKEMQRANSQPNAVVDSPFYSQGNRRSNENSRERPPARSAHEDLGVQEMLRKYQEKYKRIKDERFGAPCNYPEEQIVERSEEQLARKSFICGGETLLSESIDKPLQMVNVKQPFEFIDSNPNSQEQTGVMPTQVAALEEFYKARQEEAEQLILRQAQEISTLVGQSKYLENQRLQLEKQLLKQQMQFDTEQRSRDAQYSRELRLKHEEIEELDHKLHAQQERHEVKLETYRDRLRTVEKTVYSRVESEYARILQQNDEQIQDQSRRLASLEQELIEMQKQLEAERQGRQLDREAEVVRERKRALAEKELAAGIAAKESDKEMRRYKERIDQDYEFRVAQLEARYQQQLKQKEVDLESEREAYLESQRQAYEQMLEKEVQRLQDEQVKQHGLTTQSIYEDVTRTLKDEQKRRLAAMRKEIEATYEEKQRQLDHHYAALLARERQAVSKVELKNAELEVELEELKNAVKNKENSRPTSSGVSTDKELSKKLKKLSMSIK